VNEPNSSTNADLEDALDRLEQKVSGDEEPKRSGVSAVAVAALLMAFIALGGAAYSVFVAYQQQQASEQQQQASGSLDARLLALEQPIRQAEQELAELAQTVDSLQTSQSKQASQWQRQLGEVVHEVQAIAGTSRRDWLLAEVEYLLKLANQRVLIEKDLDTAIELLMAADDILEKSEGISSFKIREAIANDLAKLRAVGGIDLDGLFLQIGAMVNQVNLLKQKRMSYEVTDVIAATADVDELIAEPPTGIGRITLFFDKLYKRLSRLVDFRRNAEPIRPILPPAEDYYLRQNLMLKLEQAQVALIKGTQTVFQYSLEESLKWVEKYFEPTDPLTQSTVTTLRELLQVRVERQLPDISSSLILIRNLITDMHESPDRVVEESGADENL
jgi:uroporphyrin-3 C-methyltransferase